MVQQCRSIRLFTAFVGTRPTASVNAVAGLALVALIARQSLLHVPQVVTGGAAFGDIVYNLSLATLGAWLLHLLVVLLPR